MAQSAIEYLKRDTVDHQEEAPIHVLHVDDEAGFLKAAKQVLEMQGNFHVETATSVEEAFDKMREKEFDAIVSDYVMPGRNGLDFLKELRKRGDSLPFVIFTGKGREEIAIKALNLGADRYFNKIGNPETVYAELSHGIRQIVRASQAEKNLKESEGKYRDMVELAPDSIITVDTRGVITSCNTAATRLLGYSRKEMIGKHFSKIGVIRMRDLPKFLKLFSVVLRGKISQPLGLTFYRKNGTPLLAETRVGLLKEGNKITGIQAVSRDITERKKAEEALRASQDKFKGLFAGNPEPSVYVDPAYHIQDVNPRFEELFGYSLGEIKGKHINDVVVPKEKIEEAKMLDKKSQKGYVYFDTVRKRKDGSLVPVSISVAPINVKDQFVGFVAVYKDISRLEEYKNQFQTLFNHMVDPVAVVDGKGKILAITNKLKEITGFKNEELVGKNFLRTKIASAKTKATLMKNLTMQMMGMHLTPYEIEILTKDGRRLPFELKTERIEYRGNPADMIIFRDIAKRKKMEAKLRVVGGLTRHDARNKLSTVKMNIFLAKQKLPRDHEATRHLGEVESACEDVEGIFEFARIYEKIGLEELTYTKVEQTLEETVRLFSDLHGVKVINNCKGLTVLADSLLRQLFSNLIDNSLRHGKRVRQIRVYYREAGKDTLELVYEDDGVGIPRTEKEKIFMEAFGKGSGYGLFLIRKMCEVYGWIIKETGKQGRGVQFTLNIPKTSESGKITYRLN